MVTARLPSIWVTVLGASSCLHLGDVATWIGSGPDVGDVRLLVGQVGLLVAEVGLLVLERLLLVGQRLLLVG